MPLRLRRTRCKPRSIEIEVIAVSAQLKMRCSGSDHFTRLLAPHRTNSFMAEAGSSGMADVSEVGEDLALVQGGEGHAGQGESWESCKTVWIDGSTYKWGVSFSSRSDLRGKPKAASLRRIGRAYSASDNARWLYFGRVGGKVSVRSTTSEAMSMRRRSRDQAWARSTSAADSASISICLMTMPVA